MRGEKYPCSKGKGKVMVHTLDIAPLRTESPPQKRSGMARVLKGFHSFTYTVHTNPHVHPQSEWAIPAVLLRKQNKGDKAGRWFALEKYLMITCLGRDVRGHNRVIPGSPILEIVLTVVYAPRGRSNEVSPQSRDVGVTPTVRFSVRGTLWRPKLSFFCKVTTS